jgi:MFS family permease
MALEDVSKS